MNDSDIQNPDSSIPLSNNQLGNGAIKIDIDRCQLCLDNIVSPDDCEKNLCSYYKVTLEKLDEEEIFYYQFYKRLNHISIHEIDKFLTYHLKRTYKNEIKAFHSFLNLLLREFKKSIKASVKDTVTDWIASNPIKPKPNIDNNKTLKKMVWDGHPQELFNGFMYLMRQECKKHKPYCFIENIEGFIYSNFEFPNYVSPPNKKGSYGFIWNADKHDLTAMFRELKKKKKINSSYPVIIDFIIRTLPDARCSSLKSYLEGSKEKSKFAINIEIFRI